MPGASDDDPWSGLQRQLAIDIIERLLAQTLGFKDRSEHVKRVDTGIVPIFP